MPATVHRRTIMWPATMCRPCPGATLRSRVRGREWNVNGIRGVAAIALLALAAGAGCTRRRQGRGLGWDRDASARVRRSAGHSGEPADQGIRPAGAAAVGRTAAYPRRLAGQRQRHQAPARIRSEDRAESNGREIPARDRPGTRLGRPRRDQPAGAPGAVPREQRRAARQDRIGPGRREDARGTGRRRRCGPCALARGDCAIPSASGIRSGRSRTSQGRGFAHHARN